MKTATFIKQLERWRGDARLYKLSEPMAYGWGDEEAEETEYVIVSAVIAPFSGPETFIFPAREDGSAIDYLELDGSFQGALDHARALRNVGYTIDVTQEVE